MKRNYLTTAISLAILSLTQQAIANDKIEVIEVRGSYFNDYKVDNASGAMRTNASLLETAQAVTVIPETIIDEQLATTLGLSLIHI